jgi:hypothetical protein
MSTIRLIKATRSDGMNPDYTVYCEQRGEFTRARICATICPRSNFPCEHMREEFVPPLSELDWERIVQINGTQSFYCPTYERYFTHELCRFKCSEVLKCKTLAAYINHDRVPVKHIHRKRKRRKHKIANQNR